MGFTSEDHEKFKELRLTPLAEKFEELIADESHDHQLPEEVFMAAVDHALDARRSNKVDRLIKQAKFPLPSASIAEIHYVPGRKLEESRMKRFATHQWRADTTNLMVISATGAGKTYLVCAIGIAACHTEHSVAYTRMDDLARKLLIARNDGVGHQDLLLKLCDVDLLIIDDFLTVGIDQNVASDLFAILAERENRLPTIIASQTDPSYWVQAMPDRIAGDSIVNRLATNTRWIVLGNTDMRKLKHDEARAATDYWE